MSNGSLPHRHKPAIAGPWRVLFQPAKYSSYVNDHTLLQDADGAWHLYGCAQLATEINPDGERYIVHGSTTSLQKAMAEHRPCVDNGTRAWAPGAIRHGRDYYMYYGPSPTMMAHSIDCQHWMGNPVSLVGTPIDAAHRDHMVYQLNADTWLMYAVGIRDGFGCVSVHVSNDLVNWRFVQYALVTTGNVPLKPAWGALESPYVVRYAGWYYLFVTYTDCSKSTYQDTLVFRSMNPYDFGQYNGDNHAEVVVTTLKSHAAEVIQDPATSDWFITAAGWRGFDIPHEGCASIARLEWVVDE